MNRSLILPLLALIVFVAGLPPRADYKPEIRNQCRYGNKICKKEGNAEKCATRYKLCPEYANKALDVVWNFCMYAQEENIPRCEDQMKVEWERITQEIRNDSWELNF